MIGLCYIAISSHFQHDLGQLWLSQVLVVVSIAVAHLVVHSVHLSHTVLVVVKKFTRNSCPIDKRIPTASQEVADKIVQKRNSLEATDEKDWQPGKRM